MKLMTFEALEEAAMRMASAQIDGKWETWEALAAVVKAAWNATGDNANGRKARCEIVDTLAGFDVPLAALEIDVMEGRP